MVCESPEAVKVAAESSFRELEDAFLQTQTRIWLEEILQIRLDEQLIVSEVLADGELLFQVSMVVWKLLLAKHMELLHKIAYRDKPFASKKNTSGRYTPYSNVDSFLKICKIVGLTGIDLFSPSDVVEKRNTRKVCMCIRSFSKRARSININVPDFDVVTYTVAMPRNMVRYIRRNLELSQSDLTSSPCYYLQKHAGEKLKQDYSIGAPRNSETYSEDSSDDSSRTSSNLEDSQMSPMVQGFFWPKDFSQTDIQINENCKPDPLCEENNALRVHKSGSSHGSNSTPGTIGDDMEESCAAGMNYWLGEVLKVEGRFDAENNFQNIQSSELFGKEFEDSYHSLYKYSTDSFTDKTNSDNAISHNQSDMFVTHLKLLQRYEGDFCKWDQKGKCANHDHNSSCPSLLDKESTSCMQDEASKDLSFSTTSEEEEAFAKLDKDDKRRFPSVTTYDGPASRDEDVSDTGSILTSESLNFEYNDGHQACESDMIRTPEFHGHQEETRKEICNGKPHKKLVMKSILGGTAAFGLVFMMLLHLRRNVGEKVAESVNAFSDTQKYSSSEKVQRKNEGEGVYPAEMLKLG